MKQAIKKEILVIVFPAIILVSLFVVFFLRKEVLLHGGRAELNAYSGWMTSYHVFERGGYYGSLELILFQSEFRGVLEPSVYQIQYVDSKIYIEGYSGYTIIDQWTNLITQYKRNYGYNRDNRRGIAMSSEELANIPWIYYDEKKSFSEFSREDQEIFLNPNPHFVDSRLKRDRHAEKEYLFLRLVLVSPEVKAIEIRKGSVLDRNVKSFYMKDNQTIFLLGETGKTIVYPSGKIKQEVTEYLTDLKEMTYFQKFKYQDFYQRVQENGDFSAEEENIFEEMKKNPSDYKIKF